MVTNYHLSNFKSLAEPLIIPLQVTRLISSFKKKLISTCKIEQIYVLAFRTNVHCGQSTEPKEMVTVRMNADTLTIVPNSVL
jgi:hypothetical protein